MLDLRFTGDPWLSLPDAEPAAVLLEDYCLVHIDLLPLDVPSFYQTVLRLRDRQERREHRMGRLLQTIEAS